MGTEFYALKYDKTRQVKINIDEQKKTEELSLYINGAPFNVYAKAGSYVGCGIDAAHSFMNWIKDAIPRSPIKSFVKVTTGPSDTRKYAKKFISLGFWDSDDAYFTTPAQLSVGLDKLVDRTLTVRSDVENNVIRHNKGSHSSIAQKIRHHLRRAMPVVALIDKGNHWVTIVDMKCVYTKNNEIDLAKTEVKYIDLTGGFKSRYLPLKSLKILGWSSYWGRKYASSYVSGTLISLKSDSILFNDNWTNGWNSKIYEINSKQYLFLLKQSNGTVHIHKIKSNGSIGKNIAKYDWTKGWSNINFYTVKGKTFLFLMKAGSGSGYTNGLVHINKVNNDGTIGKVIDKHDWRAGWNKIEFFGFKGDTYVILNKDNGLLNIRKMNNDGTLGGLEININSALKNSNYPINDTDIQVVETKEAIYLYGINNTGKRTIYSQYKIYEKNNTLKINLIDTRNWSEGWLRLNIFKQSEEKSSLIISKGTSRNGLMHIHEIKNLENDAKLGKLIDDNYFRNTIFMGIYPSERWSNIQYFKARDGKLKLLLLDKYNGRVQITNMKKNGSFEDNLVKSNQLKYYRISLITSNIKKAGTSARVFVTLKGDNWKSPEYLIDTISDDFEKKSQTVQNIPVKKYFGKIQKVIIRHDNTRSKPGWHLKSIDIKEGTNKVSYSANVNQWFAKTVGDKKIKREISLKEITYT
jgi:hypothetical protein